MDLREDFGCSHVKRSLRKDSPSIAIRQSRRVAAEIDVMFEERRRVAGLRYEKSLLASNDNTCFVAQTGLSSIASVSSEPAMSSSREE